MLFMVLPAAMAVLTMLIGGWRKHGVKPLATALTGVAALVIGDLVVFPVAWFVDTFAQALFVSMAAGLAVGFAGHLLTAGKSHG